MSAYSDFEGWDYQDHRYDKAPEVVALALMDFSFFSVFRFCKNRVGDAGCAVLSKLFSHHCFITQLDLSHNRITDAGADSLIALVKARHEILNIFVDQNPMSQEKVDAIAYYTQYNRQPKYIKDLLVSAEANSPEFTAIDISNVVSQHMADQVCPWRRLEAPQGSRAQCERKPFRKKCAKRDRTGTETKSEPFCEAWHALVTLSLCLPV